MPQFTGRYRYKVPKKLHNYRAKVRKSFLHDFFFKKALALAEEYGIITADQYSQNLYAFKRVIQKQVQPSFKNMV